MTHTRPAVLAVGLRPFYLLAAMLAVAWMPLWLAVFVWGLRLPVYFGPLLWHGHEMVFGFTIAVMAGFLLTAVQNWTGFPTATGPALGALALIWLAGRVAILGAGLLPGWLVLALDVVFLPLVVCVLVPPIRRARTPKHLLFPLLLLTFAAANLAMHLQAQGVIDVSGRGALGFVLDGVMLIMVVIGGRVVRAFTASGLPGVTVRQPSWIDAAAVISVALVLVLGLVPRAAPMVAWVALVAAAFNLWRMRGWRSAATRTVPILWVLHVGYLWVVVAMVLRSLVGFGFWGTESSAVHALTVGGIGSLTLGMMSRSALGHTGRALSASTAMVCSFWLVNLAAFVRVFVPVLIPPGYTYALLGSGMLWTAAYAIFLVAFWPMLTRPRVDGRPG
jgi:uncharacterized protein involved in response to NO